MYRLFILRELISMRGLRRQSVLTLLVIFFACQIAISQHKRADDEDVKTSKLTPDLMIKPKQQRTFGLKFVDKGKQLITVSEQSIDIWNANNGAKLRSIKLKHRLVYCADFTVNGDIIAFPVNGGSAICIFNIKTGKELFHLIRPHRSIVFSSVAICPKGNYLAAVDSPSTIHLWDLRRKNTQKKILRKKGLNNILFSPSGNVLASTSDDRSISLWDVETGKRLHDLLLPENSPSITSASFSPDGAMLASSGSTHQGVILWDLSTGKLLKEIKYKKRPPITAEEKKQFRNRKLPLYLSDIQYSPDGRTIAVTSIVLGRKPYQGFITIWELASTSVAARWEAAEREIVFSSDGRKLATKTFAPVSPSTVSLWDRDAFWGKQQHRVQELTTAEMKQSWESLSNPSAIQAYKAMRLLASSPQQTMIHAQEYIEELSTPSKKEIEGLIRKLSSRSFRDRELASKQLRSYGLQIQKELQQHLDVQTDLETRRRINYILQSSSNPLHSGRLTLLRLIELLEHLGTDKARQLLTIIPKKHWAKAEAVKALNRQRK